jgi:hypothetical protein
MPFTMEGGCEPPPIERLVHRDGFYKTSLGKHIEVTVVECRFGPVLSLTLTCTEGWEGYGAECLMRVIAQRITDGFTVTSGNERSAFLIKTNGEAP